MDTSLTTNLITFSRFVSSLPQTKLFHIDPDGSIKKKASPQMYTGTCERITTNLNGFINALNNADSNTAFSYGWHEYADNPINIVTKSNENHANGNYSRNKNTFKFPPKPGILLLDLDINPYGPIVSTKKFIKTLALIDPGIKNSTLLIRNSISAGVHQPGQPSPFKSNAHVYIFIAAMSDLTRYTTILAAKLWLSGYGFYSLSANGYLLDKTLIDNAVFSPEHLDFVGTPLLSTGLEYNLPEIEYCIGGLLNTQELLDLTPEEIINLELIKDAWRGSMSGQIEAKRKEFHTLQTTRMIAKGATPEAAKNTLDKMDVLHKGVIELSDNYLLHFSGPLGEVSVRDVILNPEIYNSQNLYDPIEGSDYSNGCPTVAKYYFNEKKKKDDMHNIHSFAHGGMDYRLSLSILSNVKKPKTTSALRSSFTDMQQNETSRIYIQQELPMEELHQKTIKGWTIINESEKPKVQQKLQLPKNKSTLVFPSMDPKKKDSPHQTEENLLAVMNYYEINARYNQIKKKDEIIIPNLKCVVDEMDNTALSKLIDFAVTSGMSTVRVPELAASIASQKPYCPVQAYILSKPWDGINRFPQFLKQFQVEDPQIAHWLIKTWLIQAVAAVFELEGISASGALIFVGEQGNGKTRAFKDLTLGIPNVFLEGHIMNPSDKDSVFTACSHWIVELGELDGTLRKSDVAVLKAFLSKETDTLRKPYGRKDSIFRRRTVFAGSVNDFEFLNDPTGNRRFWPIELINVDRDETLDYQQLWAEIKTWYDAGETWYLSQEEIQKLKVYSEPFCVQIPIVDALLNRYDFEGCTNWVEEPLCIIAQRITSKDITSGDARVLAAAIRKYNGGKKSRKTGGRWVHLVPETK